MMRRPLAPIVALLVFACTTFRAEDPLGSLRNPVRADGRDGEVDYLGRLRCPSGAAPHFHFDERRPRGPYGHSLDRFELRCVVDNRSMQVLIDRQHPGYRELLPIPELDISEVVTFPAELIEMYSDPRADP